MNSNKLLMARYSSFTAKSRMFNDRFLQQTDDLSNHFLIYLLNSFCKIAWVKIEKWFSSFIYQLELWFWKFTFGMKQIGHKMTDNKTSYFSKLKRVRFVARHFYSHKNSCPKTVYIQWMIVKRTCDILSKQCFHPFTASMIIQYIG